MAYSKPNNYPIHDIHNDQEVIIDHWGDHLNDFLSHHLGWVYQSEGCDICK